MGICCRSLRCFCD